MKPIGYSYLNKHYRLLLPKLGVDVYQGSNADVEGFQQYGASKRKIIPHHKKMIDSPYEQMNIAIKYQGIRLHFFAAMFKLINIEEFTQFILNKPNSKYNRVLWFLYEWITDKKLDIPDLTTGNYIQLFEDKYYYTIENGNKNKRTRVINNAIGTREFCPTVLKTPQIKKIAGINVYDTAWAEMQKLGDALSADIIGRSINYLYTKETKSSTEIEREQIKADIHH